MSRPQVRRPPAVLSASAPASRASPGRASGGGCRRRRLAGGAAGDRPAQQAKPERIITETPPKQVAYDAFRLKGKGIKGVRSGYPGDLFCHVAVETPVKLTDKQKDLLREFDRSTNEGGAKHSPQSKGWMDKVKDFFG